MNIYQKINEVRKEIGYVQKDKEVGFGKSSYRAVTHDAVTGMVRISLIKHGVVIVPSVMSSVFHQAELITTVGDDGVSKTAHAKQRLYEATYQVEFVNIEDPADRIVTQQNAHALDNGDKAPGKAMSYATKYAMLKIFNIETGEDEESRYHQDEFDIDQQLMIIKSSDTLQGLKENYGESMALTKDKQRHKLIIAAKDKRKSELEIIEKSKVTE